MAFSGISGHVDGLLFKRNAFSHEDEVRLLYVDSDREFEGREQIEIHININDVVDGITLDPRVRGGDEEMQRKEWIEQNGFRNNIDRSLLYLGVSLLVPLYTAEDLERLKKEQES